ncbi:unnamed protein product [Musa hybrid cultivar]
MFYAPVLFKTIGFGSEASLASAVITGIVNVFATFVSIATVDKLGRRALFLQGGTQMLLSQFLVGTLIAFKFGISAFAWSWGPLGWLVPSEIFPLEIRSAGQSITVSVNMFFTFLIAQQGRRAGLSKKVKELSLLCGAELALIVFSPACNPFSPSTTPRSTPSSAASSPAAPCLLLRSIAAICCCRPSDDLCTRFSV